MKPIFYLSIDPANAAAAAALAKRAGITLRTAEPRDLPALERDFADVVLDWDFIPEDYRDAILIGTRINLIAVHGYGVGDLLATCLPRNGVIYRKRLDRGLFRALMRKSVVKAA